MAAPDAPQVEPLTLPFEEALAKLGERGYTLAVYHREGAPREYVLHDVFSAISRGSFDHWKDAVEAVLGVPVVPFSFEDAIASIGDLGLVITRLPTGPWAVKDPHSDDCWFGPTLIGALEAVLPELGAPRDPAAELVEALARVLDRVAWSETTGCRGCGAWGDEEHQPDCAVGRAEAVLARHREAR